MIISIKSSVDELKNINIEIKRLRENLCKLKKRSVELEKYIVSYLNEKNELGFKSEGTAIIMTNKTKKIKKSKKEIESETSRYLENNGIRNPKEFMDNINKIREGDKIDMQQVKIQPLNKVKNL
jgi:hypothetical protein